MAFSSVALAGGIGQGLQSFAAAYQQALNYQLEKAKAAALTDYQQKMADAAQQNATSASAQAYTDMLNKMGNEIAFPNAERLRMALPTPPSPEALQELPFNQPKIPSEQKEEAPSAPIGNGLLNPGSPGFLPQGKGAASVGPPTPPQPTQADRTAFENSLGFIGPHLPLTGQPLSSAQVPVTLPSQNQKSGMLSGPSKADAFTPTKGLYGIFQPGEYPPEQTRQMALQNLKIVADKNLETPKTGIAYGLNRKTLQPEVISTGLPLEPLAAQEARNKRFEGQNLQFGQRSTNQAVMNDFNENPATIAAKKSAVPMNSILKVLNEKNPYPEEIPGVLRNAAAVQFGTNDEKELDEIMKSPAIIDRLNSAISQVKSGTPVKEVINGIAQAAINAHVSHVQDMMLAQKKASQTMAAHGGDANDPGISLDPAALKAYSNALKFQKSIPTYQTPANRPGASFRNGFGLIGGGNVTGQGNKKLPPPGMTPQQFKAWKAQNGQ